MYNCTYELMHHPIRKQEFKRIESPDEYFVKAYKLFSTFCTEAMFFIFLPCFVNEEINIKFLFVSLTTLTNSKDCSESRIKFFVRSFLRHHWSIFPSVHSWPAFGFIEASRNYIFEVLHKKTVKNCKTISVHKIILIFRDHQKNIHLVSLSLEEELMTESQKSV
jgi:hypothetical protein